MVAGIFLLLFLTATAFVTTEEPSETLMFLVTFFVVPALAELYKFLVNKIRWKPGKIHISIALTAIAIGLTYALGGDFFGVLPPIADNVFLWLARLIDGIGDLLGASLFLYNVIYDLLMNAIADKAPRGILSYRVKEIA